MPQPIDGDVAGDDGGAEDTTRLSSAGGGAPVFVDTTGRRRWRIRLFFYAALAVVAAYGVLIGVSLLGGPVSPGSLVPFPNVLGGQDADRRPDADKSAPGADRPATPTNTGAATGSGNSRGAAPPPAATAVVVPPGITPAGAVPTTSGQPAGHPTATTPVTQPAEPTTDPTTPDTNPTTPDTNPTTPDTNPATGEPAPTDGQPAPQLPDATPGEAAPAAGPAG